MAAPLPPAALRALADAFAGEVAQRLPDLHAALAEALVGGDRDAARLALRHVHTLASGAAVVGDDAVSRHARRCEELLLAALDAQQPDQQPDAQQPDLQQPDLRQPDLRQPDLRQPDLRQPDLRQLDISELLAEVDGVALLLAPWLVRGAA